MDVGDCGAGIWVLGSYKVSDGMGRVYEVRTVWFLMFVDWLMGVRSLCVRRGVDGLSFRFLAQSVIRPASTGRHSLTSRSFRLNGSCVNDDTSRLHRFAFPPFSLDLDTTRIV